MPTPKKGKSKKPMGRPPAYGGVETTRLNLLLPAEQVLAVKILALERGVTPGQIVEEAIRKALK